MKIDKVVIVEGKSDTNKLKSIYGEGINTFETSGLGINDKTLEKIKLLNDTHGVIVFTDPDGPGNIIRDKINKFLNYNVDNAFITKKDVNSSKNKIGIAEASKEAIEAALEKTIRFNNLNSTQSLLWNDFLNLNCFEKDVHNKICNYFNLEPSINNKRLFKWLNIMNIDNDLLREIINS